ncbi:MAG: hypothetical protein DSY86_03360, partial [Marinomonas sp.]
SVCIINPYRSRKFADALGQLAKTDRIDAKTLALFGEVMKPDITPPPSEILLELGELASARRAMTATMFCQVDVKLNILHANLVMQSQGES